MGWWGRWEGGSKGRGCMYTYSWFMLRFDRKQQNSVKQLSFNKRIQKRKETEKKQLGATWHLYWDCWKIFFNVKMRCDESVQTTCIRLYLNSCRSGKKRGATVSLVSPGGSKCLPVREMRDTRIQFLGREDPLEKDMATHSSILACKIPWTEEAGRLQSMRSQKSRTQLSD